MRARATGLLIAAGIFVTAIDGNKPAQAASTCFEQLIRKYETDLNKMKSDPVYLRCLGPTEAARAQSEGFPRTQRHPARTPQSAAATAFAAPESNWTFTPLLRQDFEDVSLFSAPTSTAEASGATFSYTSDRIAKNDTWAGHGMAALVIGYFDRKSPAGAPGLFAFNVAPYASIDRLRNSNPANTSSDVNTVSGGVATEFGVGGLGGAHYFQLRGASVRDNIAKTDTASFVFQWEPVYDIGEFGIATPSKLPFLYPTIPLFIRFDPKVIVRRDELPVPGSTTIKDAYWRYGASGSFYYQLDRGLEQLPVFLKQLSGQTTLTWLEADDGRHYPWFATSVTYNLDPAGHLGLTASYRRGHEADTGIKTNMFMLGLSAKL